MRLDPTAAIAFLSFLGTLAIGTGSYLNNRTATRTAVADSADKRENNLVDQLQEEVARLRIRVTELEQDREVDRDEIDDLREHIRLGKGPPPPPRPRRHPA